MKYALAVASVLLVAGCPAFAEDPLATDGDKYKLRIENDRVRVLEYHDKPGEKTNMHEHPDFVLYALGSFKRRLTFPDGKTIVREFKAGGCHLHEGTNPYWREHRRDGHQCGDRRTKKPAP